MLLLALVLQAWSVVIDVSDSHIITINREILVVLIILVKSLSY
jgi:hypothetical protein